MVEAREQRGLAESAGRDVPALPHSVRAGAGQGGGGVAGEPTHIDGWDGPAVKGGAGAAKRICVCLEG